jgi:outer membrane protein assembly factor BamB
LNGAAASGTLISHAFNLPELPAVTRRLLPALLLALAASTASADNWPQWHGPQNNGHTAEKGLPTEWAADKNVAWKFKLPGKGFSTPAVWNDQIFITTPDGADVVVLCVGTDGKERWKKPLSNTGKVVYKNEDANDATASITTDGKHLWAFAGNGTLACFTVGGEEKWRVDLQKYGKFSIQFGCHWTPVVYKGRVYAQVMHRTTQKIVCLEADTGKEVYAVDRKGYGKGESPDVYSSAFIWEGDGGPLLVAHGNDYCTGHKLDNGDEVWRVAGLNPRTNGAWRFISNPMLSPDLIVVPSCKDGPTVAFNPVGAKGDINPENKAELWRLTSNTMRTPDVVTPIRVGDVVYFSGDGPFTAVDGKTGKELYKAQLSGGRHRAHMLYGDGKIYVTSTTGAVDVVQAGNTFKKLATNKLPDTLYASPAVSGGRIYFRGWDYLWAIGQSQ